MALARGTRRHGRTLVGGAPPRLVRLTDPGLRLLERWATGAPVGPGGAAGALARRLTDGGLGAPVVAPGDPRTASVVIPVHDRPEGLRATLAALRGCDAEVIVVDDGSSDPGQVEAVCAEGAVAARVVRRAARGGPAAARNTGWRAGSRPVVAFLDADCTPAPGWLATLAGHFDDPSLAAVAPRIVAVAPGREGRLGRYERHRSPLDMGPEPSPVHPTSRVAYLPSAALAVRRTALEQVGGFDEDLRVGEDVDLVWRLAGGGWRVRYEPAVRVGHPHRPTLAAALRQRFDYGTSAEPLAGRHGPAVAPLALPWPTAVAWAALLWAPAPTAGVAAAAAVGWSAVRVRRRTQLPAGEVGRLATSAYLRGGAALAAALRRTWWPLTATAVLRWPGRRSRVAAMVTLPLLVEWQQAGRPLDPARWCLLGLLDDAAYGAGVWAGCWSGRSARALRPRLGEPGDPRRRRPATRRG